MYFQPSVFDMIKAQIKEAAGAAAAAGAKAADKATPKLEATNFMRQFRDTESRELKQLTAVQFMEVWDHYDEDGKWSRIGRVLNQMGYVPLRASHFGCIRIEFHSSVLCYYATSMRLRYFYATFENRSERKENYPFMVEPFLEES